jgi:hypothetical protein
MRSMRSIRGGRDVHLNAFLSDFCRLMGWTERERLTETQTFGEILDTRQRACDLWLGLLKIPVRSQVGSLGLSYGGPFQSLF